MESNYSLSNDLRSAINAIKRAILQSQYKAAKSVNSEQLSLYFGIGRYISEHTRNNCWGTNAIERISEQLKKELPGLRGFSAPNLKFMRLFYESWFPVLTGTENNSIAMAIELDNTDMISTRLLLPEQQQQFLCDCNFDEFLSISFTHHLEILHKTTTLEERLFYIHQTYINLWDKYYLRKMLGNGLYQHQGTLPNNFNLTMADRKSALKAITMFKDEYLLDFINVEEIGERDKADVDERVVEQAIIQNVKNFIMTFGHDFTFVGNQFHLEKYGFDFYPDLLFYNRELATLVVVELKKGEFKPAYLGQLSAYLRILDAEVKKPFENPSIGIVLCKQADKSFVEFLIQGYVNPMGLPPTKQLMKYANYYLQKKNFAE